MKKQLRIGYFYKDLLNLYGDTGNVEILKYRALQRGLSAEVVEIGLGSSFATDLDIVFMGGGPDSGQKMMYEDLLAHKKSFLEDYIHAGKVGLFICGSYQLLGKYYKSADQSVLQGLHIFDLHTEHFGTHKKRCIGNTTALLSDVITNNLLYKKCAANYPQISNSLVGFENHGGRTFLKDVLSSLATVTKGHGNNSLDGTEGVVYKNSYGTYFHGPFLSRNPHFADFLIASALAETLDDAEVFKAFSKTLPLDSIIVSAHTASKTLKQ